MTFSNWQIVATGVCIAVAALMVLRRVIRLFSPSSQSGCQTGGCSACPSHQPSDAPPQTPGFVSLESLVKSSQAVNSTGPGTGSSG